jgi:antitoxin component YwqK of YwqJK toxin-antitoxin module
MKEGNFKLGFEDGEWQFWDEDGKHIKTVTYRSGEIVSELIIK